MSQNEGEFEKNEMNYLADVPVVCKCLESLGHDEVWSEFVDVSLSEEPLGIPNMPSEEVIHPSVLQAFQERDMLDKSPFEREHGVGNINFLLKVFC